ncbi:unnamed protein product [Bursaphelenchus okinawaensis]|uniref:Uncharacterized protein n=1 Tax=Bursaphelenchus okinawaensis TaxID=465554 RepID=A0A811K9P4_9BILA|nr:unnamed protein product [Bursaphelenchus okinawaensis]CAG9096198.1 unnamed protein product [Bursaphelenchus okinawaensis]
MKLLLVLFVFFGTVWARRARDIDFYGYLTCQDGSTCLNKECGVDLMIKDGGSIVNIPDNMCSVRRVYDDFRFHIKCKPKGYDNKKYTFYIKYYGRCGRNNQWAERHSPVPVHNGQHPVMAYVGEVNIPRETIEE